MNSLTKWAIRNRAVVDVFVLAWIIGGLFAANSIRRELFPEFSFDAVQIETILPGATPEDIERLVTDPIEDVVVDLPNLDHVQSVSNSGRSVVTLIINADATTVEKVLRDVEQAIEPLDELPDEAEDPVIRSISFEERVIVVALLGDAPWNVRKRITDNLKERFRTITGVSSVVVAGIQKREIAIEILPERLAARGLSAADIVMAIQNADANLPAGTISTKDGDILVRTVTDLGSPELVGNVIVRANGNQLIRVKDLADVRFALEDERTRSRIGGKQAANITVMKSTEGDNIKISDKIKAIVGAEREKLPYGLELSYVQDGSLWVKERLNVAYKAGIFGFILVFILLAVFLDPLSAAWCAYGIPISVLGGLLILYITGGTLNMLTIFGFILVIGM
ncbi:MAG: efflux RND transporter permease subunit, partial [Candidatus Lindowbacteria bacterium]|nr:efflux RND transporter permease subunit [Candidatus Lindowbacteria bacterium]